LVGEFSGKAILCLLWLLKIVVVSLSLLISEAESFSAQINLSSWTTGLSYLLILDESFHQVGMAL